MTKSSNDELDRLTELPEFYTWLVLAMAKINYPLLAEQRAKLASKLTPELEKDYISKDSLKGLLEEEPELHTNPGIPNPPIIRNELRAEIKKKLGLEP